MTECSPPKITHLEFSPHRIERSSDAVFHTMLPRFYEPSIDKAAERYAPESKLSGTFTCSECGRTVKDNFSVRECLVYCQACAGLEG